MAAACGTSLIRWRLIVTITTGCYGEIVDIFCSYRFVEQGWQGSHLWGGAAFWNVLFLSIYLLWLPPWQGPPYWMVLRGMFCHKTLIKQGHCKTRPSGSQPIMKKWYPLLLTRYVGWMDSTFSSGWSHSHNNYVCLYTQVDFAEHDWTMQGSVGGLRLLENFRASWSTDNLCTGCIGPVSDWASGCIDRNSYSGNAFSQRWLDCMVQAQATCCCYVRYRSCVRWCFGCLQGLLEHMSLIGWDSTGQLCQFQTCGQLYTHLYGLQLDDRQEIQSHRSHVQSDQGLCD